MTFGLLIAGVTTRSVARYGASGMTAGMAAMMAAMGTGLSVGYGAGMIWDLGWANLFGVLAGGAHGLWMGRRYGPMAALDGAGGGVMGGLMGPMLGVMLLYLPISLVLTAWLMLGLQAAFSIGAVYLVAVADGPLPAESSLRLVGWVLGGDATCCPPESEPAAGRAATDGQGRARRGRRGAAPMRPVPVGSIMTAAVAIGLSALIYFAFAGASPSESAASRPPVAPAAGSAAAPPQPASAPAASAGEIQQVAMTLRAPRYEPRLVEVKSGVPVRLTLQAIGDPG